ncbi:MAG: endo-1,4-beta-xylanase [Treponema sp.]|nr:endo-1,4-beta-xylanase [Treponema sp.]
MKKFKAFISNLVLLTLSVNLVAAPAAKSNFTKGEDSSFLCTKIDEDKKSIKYEQKMDGFSSVTIVTGKKSTKRNPITVDLSEFSNQEISITISGDIKITDKDNESYDVIWFINDVDANLPELSRTEVKSEKWTHFMGEKILVIGEGKSLILSPAGMPVEDMTFALKNFEVKIQTESSMTSKNEKWLTATPLKEAYKDYFTFGFAVEYKGEFNNIDCQDGLIRHVDSITLGNDFKPDFLFAWQKPTAKLTEYTDSTGKTIQVPALLPKFNDMDKILGLALMNNLKIRGHVLVWHSQTPLWFFKEGYSLDKNAPYVDRDTMTARQEWYIKSVLEYVDNWEKSHKVKDHIVYCWDVVNEAARDGATDSRWLREDSDWFRVYGDETFIVNAFRFANKYAPKDVLLAYNDYGTYSGANMDKGGKTNAVLKIIDAIQACPDARIDVMGMQSHVGINNPAVSGTNSYEQALQKFTAKGLDIHVTEFDMAIGSNKYSPIFMKSRYKDFFEMFLRNRKTEDKHGISCVTIWGLTDARTWLDAQKENKGYKQHPVLFEGNDYKCKPAFYGVLEAAENASK